MTPVSISKSSWHFRLISLAKRSDLVTDERYNHKLGAYEPISTCGYFRVFLNSLFILSIIFAGILLFSWMMTSSAIQMVKVGIEHGFYGFFVLNPLSRDFFDAYFMSGPDRDIYNFFIFVGALMWLVILHMVVALGIAAGIFFLLLYEIKPGQATVDEDNCYREIPPVRVYSYALMPIKKVFNFNLKLTNLKSLYNTFYDWVNKHCRPIQFED